NRILKPVIALVAGGLIFTNCSSPGPVTDSVRFALFGNTQPDSPFRGFTGSLNTVLKAIDSNKPQIIIHTGNSVYSGSDAEGILESDVNRQMNIFFSVLKGLHLAIYTIPGDRDYHNGTLKLYI